MCDYSLEMYRSRPARAGERYVTHRFASGSIGFIAPGDADTAVCMACDTQLKLAKLPVHLRNQIDSDERDATFVRLEQGPHHDGVRLADGSEITLQQLGPGIEASVIDAMVEAISLRQREMEPAL